MANTDKYPYVIISRNHYFWIVGPFSSEDAAAEWGAVDQEQNGDDPRWQVVTMHSEIATGDPVMRVTPPRDMSAIVRDAR